MSEKDLRLNSLSRFEKHSPHLILEEHGHCEVPAGCGGAVLRWRNSSTARPVRIYIYTQGNFAIFLDGKPLASSRPLVKYGDHVFSFRIWDFDPAYALFIFAAIIELTDSYVLSLPSQEWKYSLLAPTSDDWMRCGFDASRWASMVSKPISLPGEYSAGRHSFEIAQQHKAQGLGIVETDVKTVWVRKPFRIV